MEDESFTELTESEKLKKWKWARNSREVQDAKRIQREFVQTVKLSKQLVIKKKEDLKKKQLEKTHKMLDICKLHGGPLTMSTINDVTKLNEKELLTEIGYLRLTTHPNIQ